MKIYNQSKTQELVDVDLSKGYLKDDKIFVAHHDATEEIAEQSHYRTIKEYPNGGKDVEKIIDIAYQPARDAYDEYEDAQIFIPYTESELLDIEKDKLREWREKYFEVIDRAVWYDSLNDEQKVFTKKFRKNLLDITISMKKPEVPDFIQAEIKEV